MLNISKKTDILIAISLSVPLIGFVIIFGDPLFIGIWYYIVLPFFIVGFCERFRPAPLFASGTALSIAISLYLIMQLNLSASRIDGMVGLIHFFSMPAGFVGAGVAAFFMEKKKIENPAQGLLMGVAGYGAGFFVARFILF